MSSQPNVLWIGVDQMRADTPGYSGNAICQTPTLNRLAAESVVFNRAYTTCSLCSPARGSMFTGRFAFHHGMGTNCDMYHAMARELPHPEQLLHHRLQTRGYRCGFAGKWHVGTTLGPADYGFDGMSIPGYGDLRKEQVFQRYLAQNNLSYGPIKNPVFGNPGEQTLLAGEWDGPLESTPTYYLTNYTIDLLKRFADARAQDGRSFFLTCQYWAPHPPYLPSPEYVGLHDRAAIEPWANFEDDYSGNPASIGRFRRDFYRDLPGDWDGWREIVGLAYDFTSLLDGQVGRLLAQLDALGLAEDTLVIFTSDHGDMAGSHGGLFDKGFMYEEAHRVPLLVRSPGYGQGFVRDELVYNMDIMPTIFDLLGEDLGDEVNGRSFLTLLDRDTPGDAGREAIYLEFHGIRCLHTQRALVTRDGFKYVFNPVDEDEFYDLNRDLAELHNCLHDPAYTNQVERARRLMVQAAGEARDPVQNYIAKLFGDYTNLAAQPDVSAAYAHESKGG